MADIATTYLDADSDSPLLARPALLETTQRVNRMPVNVKDYGAMGDGSTNDTTAVQNAINYAISQDRSLHFPAGTYKCANLSWTGGSSTQIAITGDSCGNTSILNTIDTNPVMTIQNGSLLYISGLNFRGNGSVSNWGSGTAASNNLVGTRGTNAASLRLIDCVHMHIDGCNFENSLIGCEVRGGVIVTFTNSYAYWNDQCGWKIWQTGGSGYPNLITIRDSHPKENGQCGIYFDHGRLLVIDGADIEGNGKNTTVATSLAAGVYIGSSIGLENGASNGPNGGTYHTQAASITNCWFEQNGHNNGAGVPSGTYTAQVVHNRGILIVDQCNFTNTTSGRYFRINGGQYTISNCSAESALASSNMYIDEGATSGNANLCYPNYVINFRHNTPGTYSGMTATGGVIDASKTTFGYRKYTESFVQSGAATTASGTVTVTFPTAYTSISSVVGTVLTNDSGQNTYTCEIYDVTNSSFKCRVKSRNSGGSVNTTGAHTFYWIATGT